MKSNKKILITILLLMGTTIPFFAQNSDTIPCKCDSATTVTIYVNIQDMIPGGNAHYYSKSNPFGTIKFKSPVFKHPDIKGKLVPRVFSDSRELAKLMVRFELSKDIYESKSFKDLDDIEMQLIISVNEKLKPSGRVIVANPDLFFSLKPNSTIPLGPNVFHHQAEPITLTYPELWTIPAISADIEDKLSGMQFFYEFDSTTNDQADPMQWKFNEVRRPGNHQDSAYVRAINLLNDREFKRSSSVLLGINQVEDLMKLYLYLKSYVEPNSFYNQEAKNLAASIIVMEYALKNVENDSIRAVLNFSRNVYEKYSSTIDRLNSLFINTKVVLFHNGILSKIDQKEYFLLQKEAIIDDEIAIRTASFGAFVTPTRLRFSSPAKFTNDFTIGASLHFPVLSKPVVDIVAGLGLSAITTDSVGSERNLKMAAITNTIGLAISPFSDHFQISLLVGWDTGNLLEYQKKPWLAVGAMYRLKKSKMKPARPRE